MKLSTASEKAKEWGISNRRVQMLASTGRIPDAEKIGGIWLIPETSYKPTTDTCEKIDYYHKTVKNRIKLKTLLKKVYFLLPSIESSSEIRLLLISTLNTSILTELLSDEQVSPYDLANYSYKFLGGKKDINQKYFELIFENFLEYVRDSNGDLLNTLSWTYQYLNTIIPTSDNQYTNTQFFTEQYMIEHLLSQLEESYHEGNIFDPCCGGGNMLTAAMEKVFFAQNKRNLKSLQRIMKKIVGFDVDPFLARVAVLNIKSKGIELLLKSNEDVSFEIWKSITPQVFFSNDKVEGSLAKDMEITDCTTGKKRNTDFFHGNCDVVITNPPFATVKGMDREFSNYLRKIFPLGNSDLSASFILKCGEFLKRNGTALMVVQNSWMFLDSFTEFRRKVLTDYYFKEIFDLGSGAFLDLSGEKSSVVLIKFSNSDSGNDIKYLSLKNKSTKEKINGLLKQSLEVRDLNQKSILLNEKSRFDVLNVGTIKNFYYSGENISNYATPMQGTSTGNNKELVGYFWEHFGDNDWKIVSKGGGYSRWQGLNKYVVKWGIDGEFIKKQKGSAIRNSKYFEQTELVFSDTGTSGLNVRVLIDNQIFIASGPGIRINKGNTYALLALLNSRLASYYLRILSPKLTIAAGYIAKIPVNSEIANSTYLAAQSQICINSKKIFLMNRPNNYEFSFEVMDSLTGSFTSIISTLILNETKLELQKIEAEENIEKYIMGKSEISYDDTEYIWAEVGFPADMLDSDKLPQIKDIDNTWASTTDTAVYLKKNKIERHHIASDGIIEFIAQKYKIKPSKLVKLIEENIMKLPKVREKYQDLLLHNGILQFMSYDTAKGVQNQSVKIEEAAEFLKKRFNLEFEAKIWIKNRFETVHADIFIGSSFIRIVDIDGKGERLIYEQ